MSDQQWSSFSAHGKVKTCMGPQQCKWSGTDRVYAWISKTRNNLMWHLSHGASSRKHWRRASETNCTEKSGIQEVLRWGWLPLGTRTWTNISKWKAVYWGQETWREHLGSYAEALCVVTVAVLFTLTRDTSWSSKGAYRFQNQIAVMQKRGWGKRLFVPN